MWIEGKDMAKEDSVQDILPVGELSPIVSDQIHIRHGLLTPMRDGLHLSMDLIRPDLEEAFPVILIRTPYNKVLVRNPFYESLARRGYIVAIQDTRGRFNSDGEFFPYINEAEDGYDTVEWIAEQSWCDGNIGMAGGSYVAQTQWFAASQSPPHLKAIVPICSPPDAFSNEPILNGVFLLPMGEWMLKMGRRSFQDQAFMELFTESQEYFDALPISELPDLAGTSSAWWDEMMRHPNWDDLWKKCSYQKSWSEMDVAALNITGWYDMNFPGAPTNFSGMSEYGATEYARSNQHLIIGPWPHWVNRGTTLNGVDFGKQAVINLNDYIVKFYDRWLKGVDNGIEDDKPVHVFLMGANEWRTFDDWPVIDAEATALYLHSSGHANSLKGDGSLSFQPPGDEAADTFLYDPADPNGMLWNLHDGPVDDRIPSIRDDMLCYTSAPLTESFDIIGPISIVLYAASSALDTDWHARLVDVYPDGSARYLCHGALRARFRNGFETPEMLVPDHTYEFKFGMDATGNRFLAGHRIRLEITSSWFPKYDRNTNSGAPNNFQDNEMVIASQRVLHDAEHPSHILIPVVAQGSQER